MNSAYYAAKLEQRCTYPSCDQPPADGVCQCAAHASAAAARVRKSTTRLRAQRRAAGQCAYCGRGGCATYGCAGGCGRRQMEMQL